MNLSVILLPVYKERRDRSGYIFRSSQVDDIDPKLPKSIETVGGYQMPKCAITSELRVKVIIGKFFVQHTHLITVWVVMRDVLLC